MDLYKLSIGLNKSDKGVINKDNKNKITKINKNDLVNKIVKKKKKLQLIEKVKYDIACDLVPTYLKSLKDCMDPNMISRVTKSHIEALIRVTLPNE